MSETLCPCGKPLHYINPNAQYMVEMLIRDLGETMKVTVLGRTWVIPRHYIALHGLIAHEIPELAKRYGWEEV